MSDPTFPEPDESDEASPEEMQSALFAQLVMQQANLAMMLLGKTPHPESGEKIHDLEGARMFIDQLEMLEAKTKGNLNKAEETLLRQSLMSLQMAFVQAVEAPAAPPTQPGTAQPSAPTPPADAGQKPVADASASEAESRKKFSRKY